MCSTWKNYNYFWEVRFDNGKKKMEPLWFVLQKEHSTHSISATPFAVQLFLYSQIIMHLLHGIWTAWICISKCYIHWWTEYINIYDIIYINDISSNIMLLSRSLTKLKRLVYLSTYLLYMNLCIYHRYLKSLIELILIRCRDIK